MKASVSKVFRVFTELRDENAMNLAKGKNDSTLNHNLAEVAGVLGECNIEIEISEELQKIIEKK